MTLLTDDMRLRIEAALARYGPGGERLVDPHTPSSERREQERRWARERYARRRRANEEQRP